MPNYALETEMMEKLENEFKRRFQNKEITDNSNQSDDLWNAISEEIDKNKGKSRTRIGYFWFLPALLFFVGISYLLIVDKNSSTLKDDISETENQLKNSLEASNTQKTNPSDLSTPSHVGEVKSNADQLTLLSKSEKDKIKRQKNKKNINKQANKHKLNFTTLSNSKHDLTFSIKEKNKDKTFLLDHNYSTPIQDNTIEKSASSKLDEFNVSNSNYPILNSINRPLNFPIKSIGIFEDFTTLNDHDLSHFFKSSGKKLIWQIGLSGGINQFNITYHSNATSDIGSLKENSESALIGASFGINTNALVDKKWLISTGVEYHQYAQKFEFEQQSSGQILKENQPLTTWIDASSGDTLNQFFGDALVNTTTIRNVLHYNDFRQISIPIELGWQHSSKRWLYGIMVGGVLNFTTKQEGKSLNLNVEIAEINQDNDLSPLKTFALGMRIAPFIGYQLHEKWSLKCSPRFAIQGGGYSSEQLDLNSRIRQFNLDIGAYYTID